MVLPKRNLAQEQHTPFKLVHVIRHGEAQHNVSYKFTMKPNVRLTARGKRQARALRLLAPKLTSEVVLTSPVFRALQTTQAMCPSVPIAVLPDARERIPSAIHLCDLPVDLERPPATEPFKDFKWSLMKRGVRRAGGSKKYLRYLTKTDLAGGDAAKKRRGRRLTAYLESRPENNITLVSHGAFLMHLTGDTYMRNCEVRTYKVAHGKWQRRKAYYMCCRAA